MKQGTKTLVNFLCFHLVWMCSVLGAAKGLPWLGPFTVIPVLLLHFHNSLDMRRELSLLIIAACIGIIFDQTILSLGWISFAPHFFPAYILPLWMVSLWLGFSTTLNVSLRWLRSSVVYCLILGGVGGPLAYIAAEKLGAITLINREMILPSLAIGWAIITLMLVRLSIRYDGFKEVQHV